MAYTFEKYGTFTGPAPNIEYRDNDDFSVEPFDGYFNLNDVSMVLVNTIESPADYVYMHLAGSSTSSVTLERSTGPIPTFNVEANQTNFSGDVDADGTVTASEVRAGGITLTSRKAFDIPHPNKKGWRLRHICLEGPESAVYYRGRLTNSNVINLPDYWRGLINPETITVSLTQIGSSQDLIVDKIDWGSKIVIRSGNAANIDCYFLVHAERIDGEKLIVEYEGDEYPGDDSQYSLNK
jgi:hypothetical protein